MPGTVVWDDVSPVVPYKIYAVTQSCADGESPPSNQVGYVTVTLLGSSIAASYTPFGLPFKYWYLPTAAGPVYGTENRKPSSMSERRPSAVHW
jgi:hypothetical protein